jgi:hypothetical protein
LDHPVIDLPFRGTIGKDIADALLLIIRVGPIVRSSYWHGDACEDDFVYVCIEWIVVKWLHRKLVVDEEREYDRSSALINVTPARFASIFDATLCSKGLKGSYIFHSVFVHERDITFQYPSLLYVRHASTPPNEGHEQRERSMPLTFDNWGFAVVPRDAIASGRHPGTIGHELLELREWRKLIPELGLV